MSLAGKAAITVGLLVLAAGTAVPVAARATGGPHLDETPFQHLRDGQVIMVSGVGWVSNHDMTLEECTPGGCDGDNVVHVTTDADGAFPDTPFTVHTGVIGSDGSTCPSSVLPESCSIGAFDGDNLLGTDGIHFDPALILTPSAGLHVGDVVKVTGLGFPADSDVATYQCHDQSGPAACRLALVHSTLRRTDDNGVFTGKVAVDFGKFGNGSCGRGATCAVMTTPDWEHPNKSGVDQIGTEAFTFADVRAATSATIGFRHRRDLLFGSVVSAAGKAVGLKSDLEVKLGMKWRQIASDRTGPHGFFAFRHVKSGTYRVTVHKSVDYKGSHSPTIKAKA